jgi:hypothetical protein
MYSLKRVSILKINNCIHKNVKNCAARPESSKNVAEILYLCAVILRNEGLVFILPPMLSYLRKESY